MGRDEAMRAKALVEVGQRAREIVDRQGEYVEGAGEEGLMSYDTVTQQAGDGRYRGVAAEESPLEIYVSEAKFGATLVVHDGEVVYEDGIGARAEPLDDPGMVEAYEPGEWADALDRLYRDAVVVAGADAIVQDAVEEFGEELFEDDGGIDLDF